MSGLVSADDLAAAFVATFPNPAHLIVEEIPTCGCGQKFNIYAASASFDGVKTLERHKKVQAALAAEIARLHALSLKLWTPEEWAKRSAEVPAALLATDRGSAATTAAAAEPAAVIEAAPAAAAEEAAKADA